MESTERKIYPGTTRGPAAAPPDPPAVDAQGRRIVLSHAARYSREVAVQVPVMIAISIANGSGDAQGSERGLEYHAMSGLYAEFAEKEVLPRAEKEANVKLTKDPDARATMGGSSGGSAALEMAWYHPDLYHRVLT